MSNIMITLLFTLIWWGIFYYSFHKDRSRYRNCHLLAFALLSMVPFALAASGEHAKEVVYTTFLLTTAS